MTNTTPPTTVRDELATMSKIVKVMETVDREAADRIAGWIYDRYRLAQSDDTADDPEAVRSDR